MATLAARGGLEGRERVYILPRVNPPFQNSPYIPPSPPTVTPSLTPQPLLLIIIIIMGGGGVVISGRRSQTVVLRRQKTAEWLFVSSPAGRRGRRGEVGRGEVREGGRRVEVNRVQVINTGSSPVAGAAFIIPPRRYLFK